MQTAVKNRFKVYTIALYRYSDTNLHIMCQHIVLMHNTACVRLLASVPLQMYYQTFFDYPGSNRTVLNKKTFYGVATGSNLKLCVCPKERLERESVFSLKSKIQNSEREAFGYTKRTLITCDAQWLENVRKTV